MNECGRSMPRYIIAPLRFKEHVSLNKLDVIPPKLRDNQLVYY